MCPQLRWHRRDVNVETEVACVPNYVRMSRLRRRPRVSPTSPFSHRRDVNVETEVACVPQLRWHRRDVNVETEVACVPNYVRPQPRALETEVACVPNYVRATARVAPTGLSEFHSEPPVPAGRPSSGACGRGRPSRASGRPGGGTRVAAKDREVAFPQVVDVAGFAARADADGVCAGRSQPASARAERIVSSESPSEAWMRTADPADAKLAPRCSQAWAPGAGFVAK